MAAASCIDEILGGLPLRVCSLKGRSRFSSAFDLLPDSGRHLLVVDCLWLSDCCFAVGGFDAPSAGRGGRNQAVIPPLRAAKAAALRSG